MKNKTNWGYVIGAVVALLALGSFYVGTAYAKNTDNDRVLSGEKKEFVEYFKTDKLSCNKTECKNYLYTVSQIDAPPPGKCNVVTGASEKTLAIFCNNAAG